MKWMNIHKSQAFCWLQTQGFPQTQVTHGRSLRITKNWFKAWRSSSDIVTALSPKVSCRSRWRSQGEVHPKTSRWLAGLGMIFVSYIIFYIYIYIHIYIYYSNSCDEISHWHTLTTFWNRWAVRDTKMYFKGDCGHSLLHSKSQCWETCSESRRIFTKSTGGMASCVL